MRRINFSKFIFIEVLLEEALEYQLAPPLASESAERLSPLSYPLTLENSIILMRPLKYTGGKEIFFVKDQFSIL